MTAASTAIARLDTIPDGAAVGLSVESDGARHDLIVVRFGKRAVAYVNACPHLGTPLETFPGRFLDHTGKRLLCSTHGALFRREDGFCVFGPCVGLFLVKAPVSVVDGAVVLTGPVPPPLHPRP